MSGSNPTIDADVSRRPSETEIVFAPFTTCAAVSTSPGETTIPLPFASPVEHPVTVSPTTPEGGSGAQAESAKNPSSARRHAQRCLAPRVGGAGGVASPGAWHHPQRVTDTP